MSFLMGFNPDYLIGVSWGFPGEPVEHIETHAAHVFLCGDRAFKIKKEVKLPYLDFSTVALRRAVLRRELAINSRFAPDLYLEVIEKDGEPVLVMKRFQQSAMLARLVGGGGIADTLSAKLAAAVAEAHAKAEVMGQGGSGVMAGLGAQLSQAFRDSPDIFPSTEAAEFTELHHSTLRRLTPLLNARGGKGLVRRCHGDMHCANIVIIDGKPVLFDAIEFSEKIATIDVLYDLAFLIMDLLRHGEPRAANHVLGRYLHLRRAEEDLSGLAALPLFLSTRAGVRALVTADLAHELPDAEAVRHRATAYDYFRACVNFLKPARPQLVCIGGLSGTGKSTLAAGLAPEIGPPPGAIRIRSDIERKVLAGVDELHRLGPEHYTKEKSLEVYDAMYGRAGRALAAGASVVMDAVFAKEAERQAVELLARECGVKFHGLWLEADPRVLMARVEKRVDDASDATPKVVEFQSTYDLGDISWTRLDVSSSPDDVLSTAKRWLKSA